MHLRFLAALAFAGIASTAHSQPANNNFLDAEVVATIPFADTEPGIASAFNEANDPIIRCSKFGDGPGFKTVWYRLNNGADTRYVTIDSTGSDYDTLLSVYTGNALENLQPVLGACNDEGFSDGSSRSRIVGLRLAPQTTYYIEVARAFETPAAAQLVLSVTAAIRYQVTTTADTNDGTCDAQCSLREAVGASNVAPGAILLPAGTYALSRFGADEDLNATGDLDVLAPTAIFGAGSRVGPGLTPSIIDGLDGDRIFQVDPTQNGRIDSLFVDVLIGNGSVGGDGGGVLAQGNLNTHAFDRVAIRDNVASGFGGGVRSLGRLQVQRSAIAGNSAGSSGGGISSDAMSSVAVEISHSTVNGNTAQVPGGGGGGGIHGNGHFRIDNSTVSGNRAIANGGGIMAFDLSSLSIRSSTIAQNIADIDVDGVGIGGGIYLLSSGPVVIANSILADNSDPGSVAPDCRQDGSGTLTTSYSLLRQSPGGCAFTGTGDVVGIDPLLGPLADNGGPTSTQAIGPGAARDTGDPAGCRDSFQRELANDQRGDGFARVYNGRCDKGAYEFQVFPATIPGVPDLDAASDSGASDTDNVTNDNTPTFTGTCANGDEIDLLTVAGPLAPAQTCAGGMYTITTPPLADGGYLVAARATQGTVELSFGTLAVIVDTNALPPAIHAPADGGPRPTFDGGGAEPTALVTVFTSTFDVCTANSEGQGPWTCIATTSLPPGTTEVFARQRDAAGNESASTPPFAYTVPDAVFGNGFE